MRVNHQERWRLYVKTHAFEFYTSTPRPQSATLDVTRIRSQSRMDQSATAPTDIYTVERVFSSYIDIRGSRDFPPFSGARYWALELLIRDRLHDCTVGTPREHDAQLGVA